MKYPEEELDSFGKRMHGIDEQPDDYSHQETICCDLNCRDNHGKYKFSMNYCENHRKSDLDSISLKIDSRDSKEVKF